MKVTSLQTIRRICWRFHTQSFRLWAAIKDKRTEIPEYVLLKDRKLAYLVNSKAACSSIKKALVDTISTQDIEDDHSIHAHQAVSEITQRGYSESLSDYYLFSFVRNPFERIVSAYVNKFQDQEKIDSRGFEFRKYVWGIFDRHDSFRVFVEKVSVIPDVISDRHFVSQTYLFDQLSGRSPDWVGRMERMNDDYGRIKEKFALAEMPHFNRSAKYDYRSYYKDREVIDMVRKRYRDDVERFGYDEIYRDLVLRLDSRR
ncbi:MAG: sulfotransferase family 2 domain-containing protein [Alcanivorax sp.]|nr:sulfotransferase family 2 domain-containing protein [Alcanivorax sp.]